MAAAIACRSLTFALLNLAAVLATSTAIVDASVMFGPWEADELVEGDAGTRSKEPVVFVLILKTLTDSGARPFPLLILAGDLPARV